MPTAPASPIAKPSGGDQALYQFVVQQASAGGGVLMHKMVEAARQALQQRELGLRDLSERDAVATAANQLRRWEQQLCTRYPDALVKAFAEPQGGKKTAVLSVAEMHFDQLELMDDAQVLTSVTLARIQQSALQAAAGQLADLNTLVCSVLGLGRVKSEFNPLRPESFVNALKEVVEQTQVAGSMQMLWFNAMAAPLGPGLCELYEALSAHLRARGVVPVAYASAAGFASHGGAALQPVSRGGSADGRDDAAKGSDETLLTLDKLRQLLTGELQSSPPISRVEQFAQQFAQQFEGGAANAGMARGSEFAATVPAALEALTEMKQVDQVLQRLEQRRDAVSGPYSPQARSVEGQRVALRAKARDIAQALSLEVVSLMVDNMAHDTRLLEPVREVVRNLEPALLRLALVDPRFFTDKQHPARRLLHELTHRSLAFESPQTSGFDQFVRDMQAVLEPLFLAPIESAEVFETKLELLRQRWSQESGANQTARERAVDVLQHAEARNLLAEKIAAKIVAHPDSGKVPAVVIDFLCGPWAQVVAQARIKQGAGSLAAERFEALIAAMLWSAHPDLARANPAKLTRLVPRLLATLREGLETIQYPALLSSGFQEALMAIHQRVFRAQSALQSDTGVDGNPAALAHADRVHPVLEGDPWIAPEEARVSNFVGLQESQPAPESPQPALLPDLLAHLSPDLLGGAPAAAISDDDFALGCWIELWTDGQWQRTQLTWASPHGTLFLFTSVYGATQSMARRSRDKLLASGRLRLLSGQAVDQEALDAVAQTAMRNSVDSVF
jgi:hypothetical protein